MTSDPTTHYPLHRLTLPLKWYVQKRKKVKQKNYNNLEYSFVTLEQIQH